MKKMIWNFTISFKGLHSDIKFSGTVHSSLINVIYILTNSRSILFTHENFINWYDGKDSIYQVLVNKKNDCIWFNTKHNQLGESDIC